MAPNGRVAWTIAARGTVRDATWSPDGYRIAYRRDAVLAVVAGDGTGARILAQPVRAVAPAWRPGAPHTLAWVGASGRIEVRDVDSGALVWRSIASVGAVTALAWSADGHRLLARGARRVVVFDVTGKRSWRVRLPRGTRVGAAAWAPRGNRIALALRGATATSVYVTPAPLVPRRPVFTTTGTLRSLAWSPDGRRLLVRWADADQWLLLSPSAANAPITAIGSISRRFGAPPTVQGWCCAAETRHKRSVTRADFHALLAICDRHGIERPAVNGEVAGLEGRLPLRRPEARGGSGPPDLPPHPPRLRARPRARRHPRPRGLPHAALHPPPAHARARRMVAETITK